MARTAQLIEDSKGNTVVRPDTDCKFVVDVPGTSGAGTTDAPFEEFVHNGIRVRRYLKTVTTVDATVTDVLKVPLAEGRSLSIRASSIEHISTLASAGFGFLYGGFRRASGGNVTSIGSAGGSNVDDNAGAPVISFVADTSAQTVDVSVTGIAAETHVWKLFIEVLD